MKKRRLLSIVLSLAMLVAMLPTWTLTASAASGTVTFTGANSANLGQILQDGTNSTDIAGIQLKFFNAASSADAAARINTGSFVYFDSSFSGAPNGVFSAIDLTTGDANTANVEPPQILVMYSQSAFSFKSIYINDVGNQKITKIEGFLNGVSTGSVTCTLDTDNEEFDKTFDLSNETKLQNVDEIRITNLSNWTESGYATLPHGNWAYFNDFTIGDPIIPNTTPTLTSISTLPGATEDTAYTISYDTIKAASNAVDADSDPISFQVAAVTTGTLTKNTTAVTPGTTTLATGESLVWTPASNANGVLNAFTVKAYDGKAVSATAVQVKIDVTAVNDAPVGIPTISGTAAVGQTLTAATGGISDADGLGTFSYQWQVSDDGSTGWIHIAANAGSSTYTVTADEAGKYVRVAVSYTDSGNTAETLNSAAFGPNKTSQAPLVYGDITKTYGAVAFIHTATGGSGAGSITYTSSDTSVATIDANNGTVTIHKAGTTTLSATKAGDTTYTDVTKSCTLMVDKALLIATVNDDSKTYGDANPEFPVSVTGFVNGETAVTAMGYTVPTASCVASTSTDAGTAQITISGGTADNYTVDTSDAGVLTIHPKSLALDTVTANNKPYDGNLTGSGTITLSGIINSDDVTATGTFTFTDKTVQTGKTVNVIDITLGGTKAGNYTLSTTGATATGSITAQSVSIASVTIADKVYDGTTTASVSAASLSGVIVGDEVSVDVSGATATFDNGNIGSEKTVTITGLSLMGSEKNNYSLSNGSFTATGRIINAGTVLTPTVDVAAGAVAPGTSVTLSCSTAGAAIYYTIDGSTPTNSSTPYTGAITINALTNLKAIAIKAGMNDSGVTSATYTLAAQEQFSLAPGGTYYFNLSAQSVPGTVSPFLPDCNLKWVPFTYAGTVNAYSLDIGSNGTSLASVAAVPSGRSLFVANWNVTREVPWDALNTANLIFGKSYQSGGVDYQLRSLSVGSWNNGQDYDSPDLRGTPESNEWDQIANKDETYIKKWSGIYSWGQDTTSNPIYRQQRGYYTLRGEFSDLTSNQATSIGFRPALQITSDTSTVLKTVTYDMGGNGVIGTKGASGTDLTAATVVYAGTLTLPEVAASNGFIYTGTGSGTLGWYAGSTFYTSGETPTLPSGTVLTAGYGTAPMITTASLPGGTVGTVYSQALTATGNEPITWTVESGSLPTGLTLGGSTISGTPTQVGTASFTVKAANSLGTDTKALSITISVASTGGGSGGTPAGQGGASVIVNGESKTAGKAQTSTSQDGKTTTTVTVDSAKLESILASEGNGATVVIPVTGKSDTAAGVLTGEMIKGMESRDATLVIRTDSSTYTLPASEINITAVSQQFGTNVALKDITVAVSIAEPSSQMSSIVKDAAKDDGFTLMIPSVDYTVTCSYGGRTINVSSFNAYIERTIAIPDGVDPSKITTGIVVNPDGTIHHVPTRITVINGKYYAAINSLTNSTYAVVWNPIEFSDVNTHWAKESVNNMGSRMVVNGVGSGNYEPNRNMTRAEFAAVMVRALGLEPGKGASSFGDIASNEWYCGYVKTAAAYGIIKGYSDAAFGPNDMITREQAMTMIARAMKITGLKASLTDGEGDKLMEMYSDRATVSAYANTSIAECIKTGVVSGRENHTLAPKVYVTRAEVAVMAERLLQKSNLI